MFVLLAAESQHWQWEGVGFLPMSGKGVHRMTYWEPPYAYLAGSEAGWTDQFLIIVDLTDPSSPREAGRWWMPGMHAGGGEVLQLPPGRDLLVVTDECVHNDCEGIPKQVRMVDIADERNPKVVIFNAEYHRFVTGFQPDDDDAYVEQQDGFWLYTT